MGPELSRLELPVRPDHLCFSMLQEELYSYVTVSDDQTFKGKTNVTIESA